MRAKTPITLRDVARDAGVSAATVSRALSTPERVRAGTLARVLRAARERGYVLDGAARALREGRTRTIGAVIPTLDNAIFANGFSGHGIQQSPAVGRAVAELILDGGYRTIDLAPLSFERIVRGEKLLELAII